MLEIFKLASAIISKIVQFWQGINMGGFRPFWYLIGIGVLTVFGFFLRGLLFSGAGGGSTSKIVSKVSIGKGKKGK